MLISNANNGDVAVYSNVVAVTGLAFAIAVVNFLSDLGRHADLSESSAQLA
ncbi:hypothetical protein GZ176_11700 [Dermatophilus congolensis]|uniref:hypothetical protein n=1 Tax=Dermatophilus congolensis TaxID=1863 RepID=UPI001AAF9434|nr:hypothetical protein [Dermatophilus congolensis]MBO3146347.1 hypothetical protein [Dermatophilus congolensis]MBO3148610.1 hypothetical protein [Dermatophilus congolensis]MBO3157584.1 hypothetical protein [Dermatophilus congolensis]MBO3159864.1 hypothetical protein [Dermatophilus congolensis]MBO3166603.1 hypothetical protein [Dermatophilus congolensis]